MALDLGRRALHAEEFRRKAKRHAIVEVDLKNFFCLPQTNLHWPMARAEMRRLLGHAQSRRVFSESSSGRASSGSMIGIPSRIGNARPACRLISSIVSRLNVSGALVMGQTRISRSLGSMIVLLSLTADPARASGADCRPGRRRHPAPATPS